MASRSLGNYRPSRPSAPGIARRHDVVIFSAVFLGYLMLLPPQFNMSVSGSALPPYRIFLIASALFSFSQLLKRQVALRAVDVFVLAAVGWICIAMSLTSTPDEALTGSVAHIADVGLAYLFGRAAFRNLQDLRKFLLLMIPGLVITGVIIVIESVTHQHIIQPIASAITGKPFFYRADPRFGLMRAQGPFPHPISAGIFLSSFLSLYWYAGFKGWVKVLGVFATVCSFFSLSSASLLSLVVTTGLMVYNWLTEKFRNVTWRIFFIFSGIFVFLAELGTNSGTFSLLVRFASFNSVSSYHRVNIWKYGTQSVERHPWVGIGYGYWERPSWMTDSVDNFWLLIAMRFGLPASVLFVLATLLTVLMIMRKSARAPSADQQMERGLAIALSVFALGLISVAVWLSTQVWFFVLLGLTVSLASGPLKQPAPQVRAGRRPPLPPRRALPQA